MARIVLLSCVSKKLDHQAKAKELYISALFKLSLGYAMSLKPDKIFILSAKYNLLELDDVIGPYNSTLNGMNIHDRKSWSNKVIEQLKEKTDLKNDEFIFLAGEKYRRFLLPHISHYRLPLKGLGIGRQLQFLKRKNEQ